MPDTVGSTHRALFDPGCDESVVSTLVRSIAAIRGVEPVGLPPLHATVDTDALEALLAPKASCDASISVTFEYADCQVALDSGGRIHIRETAVGRAR